MKEQLRHHLSQIESKLWEMSDYLYHHPELGDQEYQSMKLLTDFLASHGFSVEKGIVGRPTAFKAVYDSGKTGPAVAFYANMMRFRVSATAAATI